MFKKIGRFKRKHFLLSDAIATFVSLLILIIIGRWLDFSKIIKIEKFFELSATFISVYASLAGLSLACIAILASIEHRDELKSLREATTAHRQIYGIFISATVCFAGSMIISVVINISEECCITFVLRFIYTYCFILSSCFIGRCIWIFDKIIRQLTK